MLMQGVDAHWGVHGPELALFPGLTIPILTHMLFQGMFFIITPALICGAFAERMKFSTMVVFLALWGTFIYCPLAHWLWGGGVLAYGSPHAKEFSAGGALGFCRRDGGPHQFRRLGVGLRLGLGKTIGLREGADAAAQPDLHRPGRGHALGGLVRIQCRQCFVGGTTGGVRFRGHPFCRGCGRRHLGRFGVEGPRQTEHSRRLLRIGRRIGLHHAGRRLRHAHAGPDHRGHRLGGLLPDVYPREELLRL